MTSTAIYTPQPHVLRIGRGPHDAGARERAQAIARLLILRDGVPEGATVTVYDVYETYLKMMINRDSAKTGLTEDVDYEVTIEYSQAALPL